MFRHLLSLKAKSKKGSEKPSQGTRKLNGVKIQQGKHLIKAERKINRHAAEFPHNKGKLSARMGEKRANRRPGKTARRKIIFMNF